MSAPESRSQDTGPTTRRITVLTVLAVASLVVFRGSIARRLTRATGTWTGRP